MFYVLTLNVFGDRELHCVDHLNKEHVKSLKNIYPPAYNFMVQKLKEGYTVQQGFMMVAQHFEQGLFIFLMNKFENEKKNAKGE